jgi:hypothetical protein
LSAQKPVWRGGLFNDGIGLGGPFEGCWLGDPGVDGRFEARNAFESAAPDLLAADFANSRSTRLNQNEEVGV